MKKLSVSKIENITLETVKESGRELDYYLIKNLISSESHAFDEQIMVCLKKYQNKDGGFGQGLEPDVQAPESSVLATNIAIDVLKHIQMTSQKEKVVQDIVRFLESKFDFETNQFEFVPDSIQRYPHAVWWNDSNAFGYFNPTPEVLGFLFQNRHYLKIIEIDLQIEIMIEAINGEAFRNNEKEHSLYSVLKFYRALDFERKSKIQEVVSLNVDRLICLDSEKWATYNPQPYKFFPSLDSFKAKEYQGTIQENFKFLKSQLTDTYVWMPDWQWMQYDDVFESKAKFEWLGYVTHERLLAFHSFGLIN